MTGKAPEPAPYAEWEAVLEEIVASGGTTLLLGGTDVGKTTFARLLVNRAVEAGRQVALLDADLGQSEIGPPACIGLAFVDAPLHAISDLTPHALAFVGSTSPPGHLLEHVAGVRHLADLAASRFLVVDTSGYLHGAGARRLNQTEFDLLAPAHVVGLQRRGELEPILAPMRHREGCRVYTPPVPAVIGKKPASFRAQRRAMRFAAYFRDAQVHPYTFDEIVFVGTWMGGGTPVAAHLLKFLDTTLGPDIRVYYAERCDRHLGLMVSHPVPPHAPSLSLVLETLKAQAVSVTVAPRLKHLLVGLEGANGKLLGLGLLEALDFRRRVVGVLTPVRAPDAARVLRLGSLRVLPNGKEAGVLKPGELG
ncbi:MAG TPA: Clp1/GlmU family protein [Chthonomonadaceae bacterium]|nr:Clp1/GlmU family protein [Chthonomonadaceae bacterium]